MPVNLSSVKICLASASPRRLSLLEQVGLTVQVRPARIEETRHAGEKIKAYVQRMAETKARGVTGTEADLILAADTVVVLGNCLMGKPADRQEARRMLRRLSGRQHRVITAVTVLRPRDGKSRTRLVTSRVRFKSLSRREIRAYVATGEPLDKAGAYGIQGLGAVLVASLAGSYSGVVGLPLRETWEMLRALATSPRTIPDPRDRRARS